jgi:hypothetical protein
MIHAVLTTQAEAGDPALQAQAWRIAFMPQVNGQEPLAVISEPVDLAAVASPLDASLAMASAPPDDASLTVIWLPSSGGADLDGALQAWLRRELRPHQAPVHAAIKTLRITCTEKRAVIQAAPEQLSDAIDAVVRFTPAARQISMLEAQMTALWPKIKAHVPLTHAVTRAHERLQPQVDRLTEQATVMKAAHLRLQTALAQLDPTIAATSKLIYGELAAAAALHDRVEMLEDPIQFACDHYELANWRLTEIGAARKGHVLEVLIILILLADFSMRFIEYFMRTGWFGWGLGDTIIP